MERKKSPMWTTFIFEQKNIKKGILMFHKTHDPRARRREILADQRAAQARKMGYMAATSYYSPVAGDALHATVVESDGEGKSGDTGADEGDDESAGGEGEEPLAAARAAGGSGTYPVWATIS